MMDLHVSLSFSVTLDRCLTLNRVIGKPNHRRRRERIKATESFIHFRNINELHSIEMIINITCIIIK